MLNQKDKTGYNAQEILNEYAKCRGMDHKEFLEYIVRILTEENTTIFIIPKNFLLSEREKC